MNMRKLVMVLAALGMLCFASIVQAQLKSSSKRLVGTWVLVSADNVFPDGHRVQVYGPKPQGVLIFDAAGRYSLHIYRKDRLKFAANDKAKGSPEENASTVQGSNTHFGRYTVNDSDASITFKIDHALFPNWEGTEQKRSFRIVNGRLTYIVANPTTGGTAALGEVVWERAK